MGGPACRQSIAMELMIGEVKPKIEKALT